MSTLVQGPAAQTFGLDVSPYQPPSSFQPGPGNPSGGGGGGGAVDFGRSANLGVQNNQIHYGGQAPQATTGKTAAAGQTGQDDDVMARVRDLVQQIMQLLAQFIQQNQNGNPGSSQNNSGGNAIGGTNKREAISPSGGSPAQAQSQPLATPPEQIAKPSQPIATSAAESTPSVSQEGVEATTKPAAATAPGAGPTSGTGPYSLNITNNDDRERTYGVFDKNENLTGEITLPPGARGTLKYEADTTTLVKQQDKSGKYGSDASRLEAYNDFVNVSYIDGRNASIEATNNKGFHIGDSKRIAQDALDQGLISDIEETIPGWYDGTTAKMQQAGAFYDQRLDTGEAYLRPNDDQLGEGKNPMRKSGSMSLEVAFGKA